MYLCIYIIAVAFVRGSNWLCFFSENVNRNYSTYSYIKMLVNLSRHPS